MATYLYKCKGCGKQFQTNELVRGTKFIHHQDDAATLAECGEVVRDYKGEGVTHTTVPGGYKEANRGR